MSINSIAHLDLRRNRKTVPMLWQKDAIGENAEISHIVKTGRSQRVLILMTSDRDCNIREEKLIFRFIGAKDC